MVAPERLTPGTIARHWTRPTPITVPSGSSATPTWPPGRDQLLDGDDGDAAENEGDRDDLGIAEQRLDLVDQEEAEDRRGQKGDEDIADEPPRHRVALQHPFEHRPEGAPVEDDDRQDRAQLDDDVERRPFLGVEAEQFGGENQVPGRGNRQELGDALDDAEDDRDQKDWHRSGVAGQLVAVK